MLLTMAKRASLLVVIKTELVPIKMGIDADMNAQDLPAACGTFYRSLQKMHPKIRAKNSVVPATFSPKYTNSRNNSLVRVYTTNR